MAKRYCFTCAHWNPEGADFCENCGGRLERTPVRGDTVISPITGTSKWKIFSVLCLVLIIILASGVIYYSSSYNKLQDEYAILRGQYDGLTSRFNKLSTDYNQISSEHLTLENRYSSLIQAMQSNESRYASIRDAINIRQGFGEDAMKFITPGDVNVKSLVTQITGGWNNASNWDEYWGDVKSMYDWIVNNVKYSYDCPLPVMPEQLSGSVYWRDDYWRYPSETISNKHGDCEDQAVLLTSMIRCYGYRNYAIWTIELTGTSGSHIAMAIPISGGQLTILDPAGKFYTSNLFGGLTSKDVRTAINEWIQYWSSQIGNPKVTRIFSDAEYQSFSSTDEFINWELNRIG